MFPVVMMDILWLMLTATAAPAVKKRIYTAPIFTVSLFKKKRILTETANENAGSTYYK